MNKDELLLKARAFLDNNKHIQWKPKDFPEDMTEEGTLDELCTEGNIMYSQLKKAVGLMEDLVSELEYYSA